MESNGALASSQYYFFLAMVYLFCLLVLSRRANMLFSVSLGTWLWINLRFGSKVLRKAVDCCHEAG